MTNEPHKIIEMWAYITADENGVEGVPAFEAKTSSGVHWMPLVASDLSRLNALRPIAEQIAIATQRRLELRRFTTMTTVATITPGAGVQP